MLEGSLGFWALGVFVSGFCFGLLAFLGFGDQGYTCWVQTGGGFRKSKALAAIGPYQLDERRCEYS